ncbi:MAG: site-specific integrase [Rikenellaceae bacterium]
MASIKLKFRPSKVAGKEGVIYYQIIRNRVIRQIATEYRIYSSEWDDEGERVSTTESETERIKLLTNIKERIKLDLDRLKHIVTSLGKHNLSFSADDVVKTFEQELKGHTLFAFMQGVISRLRELRKQRGVETYTTTLKSFMRFREGEDLLLTDINSDLMMNYEAFLKYSGVAMNTISFYTRILRAVYNRAVEQELVEQKHPFKKVYTGVDKTVKRALPLKFIKQIKEFDLSLNPKMAYARDMFLLSFYTRGMSFVDMAYLSKKDLQNGAVSYRRRKTGQQLHIKWEKCMQEIVDRYSQRAEATPYLLPIIKSTTKEEDKQYKVAIHTVNHNLKRLAKLIGLTTNLTSYCARHTWASVAKSKNIPISVISEGMGHENEKTTQIYLASLDNIIIDNANFDIISDI